MEGPDFIDFYGPTVGPATPNMVSRIIHFWGDAWHNLASPTFVRVAAIGSVASVGIFHRAIVWASPRRALEPSRYMVVLIRGAIVLLFLRLVPAFWPPSQWSGDVIRQSWSALGYTVFLSYFLEVFFAGLAKTEPQFDVGFTNIEYSMIFQGFSIASRVTVQMVVFALLAIGAHVMLNIRGMLPRRISKRYRLVSSSIVSLAWSSYYAWLLWTNQIWFYPTICVVGLLRQLPQLLCLAIVTTCWSIYYFAALVVGSTEHLTMRLDDEAMRVQWSDPFFAALLKMTLHCLVATPDTDYLREAPVLSTPVATYLELEYLKSLTTIHPQYGENGYGVINDAPELDTPVPASVKWWTDDNAARDIWNYKRLLATTSLVRWAWRVAFRRVYSLFNPQPDPVTLGFTDYRYKGLDQGRPGAHLTLLLDSPEVDESPDWVPGASVTDSEYEYESGMESDNSETEDDDDVAFATSSTLAALRDDPTSAELVAAHLRGRITRSQFRESHPGSAGGLDAELGRIIMQRRQGSIPARDAGVTESLCVVCLTNPRQIVLWPCRCLALCDDCRVALNVKDYSVCVCCRREVMSFSRLFVP